MTARATKAIEDPEVRAILRESTVHEGGLLRLPDRQLERKLYEAVDKVLKGLGGKWDRKRRGHLFPFDPDELVAAAAETGAYLDRKQALGFFQTPEAVAAEMAAFVIAGRPGIAVLEPSAGLGRLVRAALAAGAGHVHAVEVDARNVAILVEAFGLDPRVDISHGDFADFAAGRWLPFDSVVMNPPFAGGLDVEHVRLAWDLIVPGGRMAAIVGEGAFLRMNRRDRAFRAWADDLLEGHYDNEVKPLPAGTFREAGTGVSALLILAVKPS